MKLLPSDWRPDLKDTEPPFQIGPHEAWTGKDKNGLPKIVSLDPWGALSQEIWAKVRNIQVGKASVASQFDPSYPPGVPRRN